MKLAYTLVVPPVLYTTIVMRTEKAYNKNKIGFLILCMDKLAPYMIVFWHKHPSSLNAKFLHEATISFFCINYPYDVNTRLIVFLLRQWAYQQNNSQRETK